MSAPDIVQVRHSDHGRLAKKVLPAGMSYEWTSTAYQEKIAGKHELLYFSSFH